jgi:hypothetical protein
MNIKKFTKNIDSQYLIKSDHFFFKSYHLVILLKKLRFFMNTLYMSLICQRNTLFHKKLLSIGPSIWANSMFPIPRFSQTTTNPVESANAALKKFIRQDMRSLIISINIYAMEKFNERRQ